MKKISRRSFLHASSLAAASTLLGAGLAACGTSASSGSSASASKSGAAASAGSGEHAPITLMDANRDYSTLIELVHQTYPEVNLQIEPYKGRNTTSYMKKQLTTGILPDIYTTTQVWDAELQKAHLIDLSQYAVSDLYNPVQMAETDVDGATYLLPYDFTILSALCNRSLLERLGLEVPSSFAQLRDETVPQLKAAGVEVADCLMNYPGFAFQYFFNVSQTGYLNTLEGKQWQADFLAGNAGVNDDLRSCAELFQQWIDCGMVNMDHSTEESGGIIQDFRQGNTAFVMGGISLFSQNDDGTGDQYVTLPYLSEDGKQNIYVFQGTHYYGLSKALEEPGSEQKLEDALHVLEVMSTLDGYHALIQESNITMCSIREFSLTEESPYYNALLDINTGHSAPLVYAGWENYVAPFGEAIRSWVQGESTGEDALHVLEQTQQDLLANGTPYYANVTEILETPQIAQLCGQIFMEAADADAALISYNIYQPEVPSNLEDGYGANGRMLPGPMSEEDITTFLPTGWYDTIQAAHITGAQAKQIAADGCDLRGNGYPYPYVFLTKDGQPLDDAAEYRVVVCGFTKGTQDELSFEDTGIVGLDAAKEYFLRVGEVSSQLLDDALLQN